MQTCSSSTRVASHIFNNSSCNDQWAHNLLDHYSLRALTISTLKSSTRWTSNTRQALNSSYTKELAISSLRKRKWVSDTIIPPRRGWTNHKMKIMPITGRMQIARDNRFSPEVHVLANTLVPVVSTNTWWFGGWHGQFTKVTFRHSAGEGTTSLTIIGDGHKQSPTHADPPPLHQAI